MALRDQPYLPLYIQDFLTDEKLSECSASATGVYIRIMCVMHKSENYGKILLRQKHKQTGKQIEDFAILFAKMFPYDTACIVAALTELIEEKVLLIEGDFLVQKRMVYDNLISIKRSNSGSLGGKKTSQLKKDFATPKIVANTEFEYVYNIIVSLTENAEYSKQFSMIVLELMNVWKKYKPDYNILIEEDYHALLEISYYIAQQKGWKKDDVIFKREKECIESWTKIVAWLVDETNSSYYRTMPLDKIAKKTALRDIQERMKTPLSIQQIKSAEMELNRIDQQEYMQQ